MYTCAYFGVSDYGSVANAAMLRQGADALMISERRGNGADGSRSTGGGNDADGLERPPGKTVLTFDPDDMIKVLVPPQSRAHEKERV